MLFEKPPLREKPVEGLSIVSQYYRVKSIDCNNNNNNDDDKTMMGKNANVSWKTAVNVRQLLRRRRAFRTCAADLRVSGGGGRVLRTMLLVLLAIAPRASLTTSADMANPAKEKSACDGRCTFKNGRLEQRLERFERRRCGHPGRKTSRFSRFEGVVPRGYCRGNQSDKVPDSAFDVCR